MILFAHFRGLLFLFLGCFGFFSRSRSCSKLWRLFDILGEVFVMITRALVNLVDVDTDRRVAAWAPGEDARDVRRTIRPRKLEVGREGPASAFAHVYFLPARRALHRCFAA
jgi:hypothetical protein